MTRNKLPVLSLSTALLAGSLAAQDNSVTLERPGQHHKLLTVGTVDKWMFDPQEGELLRVHITSHEFDPVLQLVRLDEEGEPGPVILAEIDDPGSTSQFMYRFTEAGKSAILVHGPDKRGGGNYTLQIERILTVGIDGDGVATGTFDEHGVAHVRFEGIKGTTVVPLGATIGEMRDRHWRTVGAWQWCFDLQEDGTHYVQVRGRAKRWFHVRIPVARRRVLPTDGQALREQLPAAGLDGWLVDSPRIAFRMLRLAGPGLSWRMTPMKLADDPSLRGEPDYRHVSARAKGPNQSHTLQILRAGRYRIQVKGTPGASYGMQFDDPTVPAAIDTVVEDQLLLGGARYFAIDTAPGQLLQFDLRSESFDPVINFIDDRGNVLESDDDGGKGLASSFQFLVTRPGRYRIQVTCSGNGGSGPFEFRPQEIPVPLLTIGSRTGGNLVHQATNHLRFDGRAGQMVFLSMRSDAVDCALELFGPDGGHVKTDENGGHGRDALLALRLPKTGRYTLAARSRHGHGSYTLQLIDPEAVPQ